MIVKVLSFDRCFILLPRLKCIHYISHLFQLCLVNLAPLYLIAWIYSRESISFPDSIFHSFVCASHPISHSFSYSFTISSNLLHIPSSTYPFVCSSHVHNNTCIYKLSHRCMHAKMWIIWDWGCKMTMIIKNIKVSVCTIV